MLSPSVALANIFQSTLSVRRATMRIQNLHVPRKFQSTLSVRRATSHLSSTLTSITFQSTLSVRRATKSHGHEQFHVLISIHALRKESD